MARGWFKWVMYVFIGFAVFYIVNQLLTNTGSFLASILTMVVVAAIIYGVIYFFFIRRRPGGVRGNTDEMKKYKQAVKQSKQKYGTSSSEPVKSSRPSGKQTRKRRSNAPHLKVINGSKGKNKDKDRATF
ncbi:SA1362 family protein [Salimicrobium album]|uniref:Uncharacterized protein n=1 Tax=Salimicrobium album TaxID=50717 RepID=A0A1H3DTU1_9BACI|nr:SA1362 family protein [Salimicrobium album]SDX69528.1 hypothetical protein SAMN04488081_1092 [Salimicrobium album]